MQRPGMVSLFFICIIIASSSRAEAPLNVQLEINFLLGYLEGSDCQFYRNGSWYDSRAAQKHLREKYTYMMARTQIADTEYFIEKAASKSSLSGKEYAVKCNGGEPVSSSQWLREELERLRSY